MDVINDPFYVNRQDKKAKLLTELIQLTNSHVEHCPPYRNIVQHLSNFQNVHELNELPYLPVQLFKMLDLISVPKEKIIKTLTSSGTTGQQVSKIYLDKETAIKQSRALVSIMTSILGKKRLPMIIVDSKDVIQNRQSFSARGAGILGFSNFGRDHFYLLDKDMNVDWHGLKNFLDRHQESDILLFGFTFMVWQYFLKESLKRLEKIDLSKGILIHGGGWKKLDNEAVTNSIYKEKLQEEFSINRVHNYYGMVEQVGSIFIECENGYFHTPSFADILVRDQETFTALQIGERGLLQVLSLLPTSYPGHSLLTEDLGVWLGEDDCSCGRLGKYFTVEGRLPKAELRGCSDTHAFNQKEIY